MYRRRFTSPGRLLLAILATFAMTSSSFAHRFSKEDTSAAMLTYLSMGGTLEELCGDRGLGHPATVICEACIINATALLPQPTEGRGAPPVSRPADITAPCSRLIPIAKGYRSPPTRAPPVS